MHTLVCTKQNEVRTAERGCKHSSPLQYPHAALVLNAVTHFSSVIYHAGARRGG